MTLDKWIAVFFLVASLLYGFTAFNYPLLPFERNMVFLPSTLPKALSVLGVLLSLLILVAPGVAPKDDSGTSAPGGNIDPTKLRQYKIGQALGLIVAMVLYALALRPVGFIPATTLFLVGAGWILGERKLLLMVPVALVGAGFIWYLVHELLGIFLRPLPWFIT